MTEHFTQRQKNEYTVFSAPHGTFSKTQSTSHKHKKTEKKKEKRKRKGNLTAHLKALEQKEEIPQKVKARNKLKLLADINKKKHTHTHTHNLQRINEIELGIRGRGGNQ
jgi:hypothetical protein